MDSIKKIIVYGIAVTGFEKEKFGEYINSKGIINYDREINFKFGNFIQIIDFDKLEMYRESDKLNVTNILIENGVKTSTINTIGDIDSLRSFPHHAKTKGLFRYPFDLKLLSDFIDNRIKYKKTNKFQFIDFNITTEIG